MSILNDIVLNVKSIVGRIDGYSYCLRCYRTWNVVKEHSTRYTMYNGCFPLCEDCWSKLTPEKRLYYYKKLFNKWKRNGYVDDSIWKDIEKAVLEGK